MKRILTYYSVLFIALQVMQGCAGKDQLGCPPGNPYSPCANMQGLLSALNYNPLFNSDTVIEIPPFGFRQAGISYFFKADSSIAAVSGAAANCCNATTLMDTSCPTPGFEWSAIDNRLIACAVFSSLPQLTQDGKNISNARDIIWTWNPSFKLAARASGKMRIAFSDGLNVRDGKIIYGTDPAPLEKGKIYYWIVWAWDNNGIAVTKSSRVNVFYVPFKPLSSYTEILGTWEISKITRLNDGADVTALYPTDTFQFAPCQQSLTVSQNKQELEVTNSTIVLESNSFNLPFRILYDCQLRCDNSFFGFSRKGSYPNDTIYKIEFR